MFENTDFDKVKNNLTEAKKLTELGNSNPRTPNSPMGYRSSTNEQKQIINGVAQSTNDTTISVKARDH